MQCRVEWEGSGEGHPPQCCSNLCQLRQQSLHVRVVVEGPNSVATGFGKGVGWRDEGRECIIGSSLKPLNHLTLALCYKRLVPVLCCVVLWGLSHCHHQQRW